MKIAFIGLGNMGRALCGGLIRAGAVEPGDITGYAPHADKLRAYADETGIRTAPNAFEAAKQSDIVILAVKPYLAEEVIGDMKGALDGKALLSVAAGISCAKLSEMAGPEVRVQYIMPNTPVGVNAGVMMFEQENTLGKEERETIMALFRNLGEVLELPARLMNAGMAISGCGPAFCAMVIEALGDAGVKYGLPRAQAYKLASMTLLGTGKMQLETGMHPGALKDGVCSPAGTTILGVEVLEKAGLRAAMMDAVKAVMDKK